MSPVPCCTRGSYLDLQQTTLAAKAEFPKPNINNQRLQGGKRTTTPVSS